MRRSKIPPEWRNSVPPPVDEVYSGSILAAGQGVDIGLVKQTQRKRPHPTSGRGQEQRDSVGWDLQVRDPCRRRPGAGHAGRHPIERRRLPDPASGSRADRHGLRHGRTAQRAGGAAFDRCGSRRGGVPDPHHQEQEPADGQGPHRPGGRPPGRLADLPPLSGVP